MDVEVVAYAMNIVRTKVDVVVQLEGEQSLHEPRLASAGAFCHVPPGQIACRQTSSLLSTAILYNMSDLLADDPEWADVVPIRQYENVNPIAPIFYNEECPYGPCPHPPARPH